MRRIYIGLAVMLIAGAFACESAARERALQESIAGKILRFHILANSDSDEDQAVKALVRDAVGSRLEPLLAGAKDRGETERIVRTHIGEVVKTAEEVLAENGFSYGARAELVTAEFPVKSYGSFTFPEGDYRALRITLGDGGGHNWWCVLYPNMCFQGTVYEVTDAESGEVLREVLSPKEYKKIFNTKNYRIRWKFLEYFR